MPESNRRACPCGGHVLPTTPTSHKINSKTDALISYSSSLYCVSLQSCSDGREEESEGARLSTASVPSSRYDDKKKKKKKKKTDQQQSKISPSVLSVLLLLLLRSFFLHLSSSFFFLHLSSSFFFLSSFLLSVVLLFIFIFVLEIEKNSALHL